MMLTGLNKPLVVSKNEEEKSVTVYNFDGEEVGNINFTSFGGDGNRLFNSYG